MLTGINEQQNKQDLFTRFLIADVSGSVLWPSKKWGQGSIVCTVYATLSADKLLS